MLENLINFLAKLDPIGLMPLGCPKDEYKPEAKAIIKNKISSIEDIQDIFIFYFKTKIDEDKAKKILLFVKDELNENS
jgi:hypothetical protein